MDWWRVLKITHQNYVCQGYESNICNLQLLTQNNFHAIKRTFLRLENLMFIFIQNYHELVCKVPNSHLFTFHTTLYDSYIFSHRLFGCSMHIPISLEIKSKLHELQAFLKFIPHPLASGNGPFAGLTAFKFCASDIWFWCRYSPTFFKLLQYTNLYLSPVR